MSNALTLAYDEYGESYQPVLIILHGFFASSRNWRKVAQALAKHFHVYVLDMRNHGQSPHDPVMDYPSMAMDIEVFIDRLQLTRANLLGHSMGGKAAMWFALLYPERVNKLLVADIAPLAYRHSFDNLIQALKQLDLPQLTNRKQADELLSGAIPEASFRQFLLQNLLLKDGNYQWRIDLDIFAHNADNIIAFPEADSAIVYQGRVLFLAGELSNYISKESVLRLFPQAEIQTIANAGHWIHAQQPEAFCKAVIDFTCYE